MRPRRVQDGFHRGKPSSVDHPVPCGRKASCEMWSGVVASTHWNAESACESAHVGKCVKIVCLHARSVPPKFGRVKRPLPKHAVPDAPWRTCASDGELGGVANLLGSCSVTTDPQEARLLREFSTTTFFSFFFSKMCAVPGCKVEKLQTLYLCKVHRHPVS